MLKFCLTVAIAATLTAAPLVAQSTPRSTSQPVVQGQTQQAAQRTTTISNVPQVCQMREREIVSLNGQILNRIQAANRETDQNKKSQILQPIQNLRGNLAQAEASWNRMECARLLYNAR